MNEADIPIDIHIGKLQDWLISRRVVSKDWHKYISTIRNKINNAITDMPAHDELVKLLSGTHINYFHCLQIIEILKTTEADTKNVFGRYGSQRMKDWQDVVKAYEKDNVYIAQSAQILVRNISYEIPSLKKQISKFEQLSDEATKKAKDMGKSQNIIRAEFNSLCQQLGIKGDKIRTELVARLGDLPKMFERIASSVPSLNKSISLYSEYSKNKDCLPLVRHIAKFGNTTVYEFLYSEAPLSVEEPPLNIDVSLDGAGDDGDANEINFGEEIDFGAEIKYNDNQAVDIDWAVDDSVANEIDFNISLEESGIVVEGGGQSGGIAKDEEAFAVLDCPKYRDQFLDEIVELESFLKMRLYELSTNDTQMISVAFFDELGGQDVETIKEMLSYVEVVLSSATNQQLQYLHQVKHSTRYVDILAVKVQQKLSAIEKLKTQEILLKENSTKFLQQAVSLRPELVKLINHTKILQEQIEGDISKRYKNRVVNLMSGIHTM